MSKSHNLSSMSGKDTDNEIMISVSSDDVLAAKDEESYGRSNSMSSNDDVFGRSSVTSQSDIDRCNNNNNHIIKDDFKKADDVNPSVLAEIEDFITFSQEKRKALS